MDDDHVTHNGITYRPVQNATPLKAHLKSCPNCGGEGELYGRTCGDCKGRGVVSTPIIDKPVA